MACILCRSSTIDEIKYGELITSENVTVHLFCLLFAPGLAQLGEGIEGIQGFLIKDILDEAKRVRLLKCFHCRKPGANLGCWVESCPRAYHFGCALHNNVSFKFTSKFPTFCSRHTEKKKKMPKSKGKCGICLESVKKTEQLILIPCCNNWFHHKCLQKFAFSSGSCFKCPLCNDKDKCCEKLPELGVFLPEKDCDWELSGIIFQENLENEHKACDADCWRLDLPTFRESPWLWKICTICGSSAVHQECLSDGFSGEFICRSCDDILNKPSPHPTPIVPTSSVMPLPVTFLASGTHVQSTVPVTLAATITRDVPPNQTVTLAQAATITPSQPTVQRSPKKPSKFRKFEPWFSDDEVCSSSDDDSKPSTSKERQETLAKRRKLSIK